MSNYIKLVKNIDLLEENINSISSNPFSIEKYLLPTNEIIKKIISLENPYISKDDIDLMVDGFGTKEDLENIKNGTLDSNSKTLESILNIKDQFDSDSKSIVASKIIEDSLLENNVFPLNDPTDLYFQKAESIKKEVLDSFNIFQSKSTDLILESNIASLMIVNSIPGALLSGSVAPFVPNIPGAISVISNVMITLTQLKSKYISLLSELKILKKINLILAGSGLNTVSSFLNKLIIVLTGPIIKVLKLISNFIKKAIGSLLKHTDSKKEQKRARKIAKQLRNYNYLPKNDINSVDEEDVDDVELILEEWVVVEVGSKKPGRLGKVKRKENLNESLKILEDSLSSIEDFKNILPDTNESDIDILIYDVELESGEILYGLTIEEVSSLKEKYEIVFKQN